MNSLLRGKAVGGGGGGGSPTPKVFMIFFLEGKKISP